MLVVMCRFIDADEDGVISMQDLYLLMMGLGEMLTDDDLFGMLNMADVDCDGKVTFEGKESLHTSYTVDGKTALKMVNSFRSKYKIIRPKHRKTLKRPALANKN